MLVTALNYAYEPLPVQMRVRGTFSVVQVRVSRGGGHPAAAPPHRGLYGIPAAGAADRRTGVPEPGAAMTRVALFLFGVLVAISGALGAGAEKRAIAPAWRQTNRSVQSRDSRRRLSLRLRSGRTRRGRKTPGHDRRSGAADTAEREVHRRSRRVDDGACRVQPGVPGRHGAPRRDGPCLEGVLCQGAAGPRGARRLQAADGHRGRDQRRRVPRPRPQEAHRPGRISAEPVVVAGNDRGQSVVPVGLLGSRRGDGQDAARPGRAGAARARQHETDAGRGRAWTSVTSCSSTRT